MVYSTMTQLGHLHKILWCRLDAYYQENFLSSSIILQKFWETWKAGHFWQRFNSMFNSNVCVQFSVPCIFLLEPGLRQESFSPRLALSLSLSISCYLYDLYNTIKFNNPMHTGNQPVVMPVCRERVEGTGTFYGPRSRVWRRWKGHEQLRMCPVTSLWTSKTSYENDLSSHTIKSQGEDDCPLL